MQQGVQTDATCNIQQFWEMLANNVASVCTQPNNSQQQAAGCANRRGVLHPTMLGVVDQRCVRLYGALSRYFASLTTGQDLGRLGTKRGNKTISYLRFSLKQRIAGSHEDTGSSPDFKG